MTALPACLAALAALVPADPCCSPPTRGMSPLLYVRFAGPAGSRVTLYQGRARPRAFPAPAVVGLRPGYAYRVMLSDFPDHPGLTLFPTLEVCDSLHLNPKLCAANHPATIVIDDDDIETIRAGSLVKKVIYLEHPDRAEPLATRPDETLQTNFPPGTDLWREARQRGRPMILLHLGQRVPTAEELISQNVPGTILHPGEKVVGLPSQPPCLKLSCAAKDTEEECFKDGGDRGQKAVPHPCGGLYGLDPEDTVAEYRDARGHRSVVVSNQVCICVPRFLALRSDCPLSNSEGSFGPVLTQDLVRQTFLHQRNPIVQAIRYDQLRGFDGRKRPSVNVNVQTPGVLIGLKMLEAQQIDLGAIEYLGTKKVELLTPVQKAKLIKQVELARAFTGSKNVSITDQVIVTAVVGRIEAGPEVVTAEISTRDLTVCCHETPTVPDKPLVLVKCADRQSANIGDIITFSLRYSNVGGRPITDVAVSDSLSGRLEYVEGSAESDRDAVFTMQRNQAGSLALRWEISGKLLPGQTGRLRFKAKVR